MDRKQTLEELLLKSGRIKYTQHVDAGADLYAFAVEKDLEGVMAKRKSSTYIAGRSNHWQKIKTPVGTERERKRFDR